MTGEVTGLGRFTQAANPNKGLRDSIANFFGQGVEGAVKGRKLEDGVIKANWWDKINARSTEELTEQYYKNIKNNLETGPLGGSILALGGNIDVTKSSTPLLQKQLGELQTRKNLIDEIGTAEYKGDIESLKTKSIPELRKIQSAAVRDQSYKTIQESPMFKAQQEQAANLEARLRRQETTAQQQFNINQQRLDNAERESSRRFLLQEKRLAQQAALNAQTSQLGLQLEYARLSQSEINRREDKREQKLLTLLSGLRGLGEAFLI